RHQQHRGHALQQRPVPIDRSSFRNRSDQRHFRHVHRQHRHSGFGPDRHCHCHVERLVPTTHALPHGASPLLPVPASVSVAANATSATFTASTGTLVSDQTATVTATLNGSSKPATLSLVAPVTLSALQCTAASLASNASTTCTVTLSKSTTSSTVVTLSN